MSDETTVTVEHEADDKTATVIVADADSGSDDLAIGVALGRLETTVSEQSATLAAIINRLSAMETTADSAVAIAEVAVEIADDARETVEETSEVVEEAVSEPDEPETEQEVITPQREHPIWRNPFRLRRGDE